MGSQNNNNVNGDCGCLEKSCTMELSEVEVQAVTRVADVIRRRPKLGRDEAALAMMVGMTPYRLTLCFQRHHGLPLRSYGHLGDWSHEAAGNWVLLAI